ncbi:hypothetical protein [Salmonella bongori]|uniref:hypothetical protein n=1 Tax=Salmonella bongori TaxID=54736 RepID=UPI001C6443F2|nr:hypothetical protein [Salmonella bongori]
MATKSDKVTSENVLQRDLLSHTLASWRFFLLFTLPPGVWVIFISPPGSLRVVIALLSGMACLGSWRIWLDRRYFALITLENNFQAGEGLFIIWRRERVRAITLSERQQGALKQFRRTLVTIAALWGIWLFALAV